MIVFLMISGFIIFIIAFAWSINNDMKKHRMDLLKEITIKKWIIQKKVYYRGVTEYLVIAFNMNDTKIYTKTFVSFADAEQFVLTQRCIPISSTVKEYLAEEKNHETQFYSKG